MTTLALPLPSLAEGRFVSINAYSDEALFEATGIRIAFTTRHGGVSVGPYDSFNLGSHVNDSIESVLQNRKILLESFGVGNAQLLVPNQVHGNTVFSLDSLDDIDKAKEEIQKGTDGIVLGIENVGALLCFADCVPVIIVLPTGRVAVVHAGWRGVDNKISAIALTKMVDYECKAYKAKFQQGADSQYLAEFKANLLEGANIYIGPHIGRECFETSEEICQNFIDKFGQSVKVDNRHVDLTQALRVQLTALGADNKRIIDVNKCTVCNNSEFFSYRAQGGIAGRHGAFAIKTR